MFNREFKRIRYFNFVREFEKAIVKISHSDIVAKHEFKKEDIYLSMIDFHISALKEEISYEYRFKPFYLNLNVKFKKDSYINIFPSSYIKDRKRIVLDKVENKIVKKEINNFTIVKPYRFDRLLEKTVNVYTGSYKDDVKDIQGVYYKELDLVLIENKRHIATALINKNIPLEVNLREISLEESFDYIECDGAYYRDINFWNVKEEIDDYRFGILYYLAKEKYRLKKEKP